MGFGDLIDFPINEVPTKLAFYVVDSLDVEGMILRLPTGNLQISPQTVKMVLGLPRGSRRLEGEREKNDLFEQEWKDQYKDEKKLTTYAISKQISKTTNIDFIFRMNFLMLVANTLGECDNNYVVKTTVLENILEEDDVSEIDWCSFVYECARLSKKDWETRKRDRTEVVYYGPVTFLMVNLKGNGNDPDAANNNSNIMDDCSGNNEVGGNKDVSSSKNNECVENNEVMMEAESQKSVGKSQKEQPATSSQNQQQNVQTGASSGKSKEHNFEFTPGSQPTFDLGFDSPVAVSKPSKKTESNDEEKEYRCLQSPYMYEKVSTTKELTDDEILLARSIFCMQGDEA
ncbi:hypothetical protein CTI12_AA160090 [Artemisia annua]|uniref:Ulp1 protease family, C-terminal catalytic domain-containing protein n=1 Tax=Artemisia annua TaxID=35608 RepID=A0A2U1PF38_ARTAN|nr:hypothetical protein CTI12_AA160090 [Artemisia annua]